MKQDDDFDDCLEGGLDYKRVAWDLQDLDGMLTAGRECPTSTMIQMMRMLMMRMLMGEVEILQNLDDPPAGRSCCTSP